MKKMYCLVVTDDFSRFTWVFFLATKDETSGILKSFITRIENLVDHKVKVIRCDNGTEFKNKEMNQFCEMKGILRQYSVARTPQQNGVAERRNMTLIEAARTMLADSKLPTTFWAEAVNTACYVQNRVLVVKPHNKTPYELFHGRTPTLSFMRPFGCPVTILNTIDHLGKFDGKVDEGFFVGYSLNSKAFRVFNSRTRIVEENLHIRFSESTPNVVGSGPDWLFDIDALTRTMNYEPIVAGTQSNGFAGTKASDNAGQARKETEPVKDYILLPLWTADPPFSQDPKSSYDDGSKPSSDDGKKVDEDLRKESECKDQDKEDNVNSTNNVNTVGNVNTVSSTVNATGTRIYVVEKSVKDIIKDEVKSQLPQILPKDVSNFATPVIQSAIMESLENVLLAKSSSQPKSTYEATESLIEFELKKILLDKMQRSDSYKVSPEHKELYEGLRDRKDKDKDKDKDPPAGSNQGLKKKKTSKEAKPSKGSKSKESKSYRSSKDTKPRPKSFGKSKQVEELVYEAADTEMQHDRGTWISNIAKAREPPRTFDELMSTPINFSAYVMNHLNIDNPTQEILVGPAFNLLKGTCKSFVELEFHFEECYKAVNDQIDWNNPEGHKYPFDLSKPLSLIEGPKRQSFYGYTSNGKSTHDVFSKRRIIAVTHVKVMKWYDYGYLEEIIVRRDDQKLYKFMEVDFLRLNLYVIKDLLLLLVQKKLSNLEKDVIFDLNVALRIFDTSAENPVKEILLKLNLPDHRSILMDSKIHLKMAMERRSVKVKELQEICIIKAFKLSNQEKYEHDGSKVTSTQDGKRSYSSRVQVIKLKPKVKDHYTMFTR
ncbi:ribonuclease H-like domain-containing protein [Tanacetum coccineum]